MKSLALIFPLILLFPTASVAQQAMCNQDILPSDSDIYPIASQHGNFREWFASEGAFNLPEADWDDGWGFSQVNDPGVIFPFNKMLAASYLLTFGLEEKVLPCFSDEFICEDLWVGNNVTENINDPIFDIFSPSVITSDDGVIHVFGEKVQISGYSELIHYHYTAELGWAAENVSQIAPLPEYWSTPVPYVEHNGTLHVFTSTDNSLLHYFKQPGSTWAVENVSQDRLAGSIPFAGTPVIVRSPFSEDGTTPAMQPMLHIFGLDKLTASSYYPPRLVHYRLLTDGSWNANRVLDNAAPGISKIISASRMPGSDQLYVFAENFQLGGTAFKWQPGGWTFEILDGSYMGYPKHFRNYWINRIVDTGPGRQGIDLWSKSITPDPYVSWTAWASETFFQNRNFWAVDGAETYDIATGYPKLHLFATNFEAELIHFWRTAQGDWQEENLSQRWGHHMWIPDAAKGPGNTIHLFGNSNGRLVHYYWSEEQGWVGENYADRGRIDSGPIVVPNTGNEQHVVAVNADWDLIHFSQIRLADVEELPWPWHTRDYYAHRAHGADLYKHVPRETVPEGVAASQVGLAVTDQVEMSCLAFESHPNLVGVTGSANRAAVMLHESIHQRYGDPVFGVGMPHDTEGDDWFAHGVYWGQLGIGVHSPIQLQAEFLSDIGEFPADWVPFSVFGAACDEANALIEARIKPNQDPGWRCGDLRPFP